MNNLLKVLRKVIKLKLQKKLLLNRRNTKFEFYYGHLQSLRSFQSQCRWWDWNVPDMKLIFSKLAWLKFLKYHSQYLAAVILKLNSLIQWVLNLSHIYEVNSIYPEFCSKKLMKKFKSNMKILKYYTKMFG